MSVHNQSQSVARAIHNRLSQDVAVQDILGQQPRLYDHIPKDPIYPYLTYGPMRSENISGDDSPLITHTITLHLWSRYGGRAEIMDGISAVCSALETGTLSLSGARLVSLNVVFSDNFRAPDGRTLHGVIRLNVITEPIMEAI